MVSRGFPINLQKYWGRAQPRNWPLVFIRAQSCDWSIALFTFTLSHAITLAPISQNFLNSPMAVAGSGKVALITALVSELIPAVYEPSAEDHWSVSVLISNKQALSFNLRNSE